MFCDAVEALHRMRYLESASGTAMGDLALLTAVRERANHIYWWAPSQLHRSVCDTQLNPASHRLDSVVWCLYRRRFVARNAPFEIKLSAAVAEPLHRRFARFAVPSITFVEPMPVDSPVFLRSPSPLMHVMGELAPAHSATGAAVNNNFGYEPARSLRRSSQSLKAKHRIRIHAIDNSELPAPPQIGTAGLPQLAPIKRERSASAERSRSRSLTRSDSGSGRESGALSRGRLRAPLPLPGVGGGAGTDCVVAIAAQPSPSPSLAPVSAPAPPPGIVFS